MLVSSQQKKMIVVPDVHGRLFWRKTVKEYMDAVDRVVFLGDYLDPYAGEERLAEDIFENLMEIIALKQKNREKVVLLKGNHDQHYASERFEEIAGGTRMDYQNWNKYHEVFTEYRDLFQIAYMEQVNGVPYVFSHAGLTRYWLEKVNEKVWNMFDSRITVAAPEIIERINQLDDDGEGQDMLAVIGCYRSMMGEKTGSVLWADMAEHDTPVVPGKYGLNKVFQVFGHTKLPPCFDKLEYDNICMIDSRQCFIIDEQRHEKIMTLKEYGW